MSLPPLPDTAVLLGRRAPDWRGSVRLAAEGLTESGSALPAYGDEMIRMIEDNGPYIVIAPGLALAHARPGPTVKADGLSIVTLTRPVHFGHPHNDPVSVVLGLATTDASQHLAAVAGVANVFNDERAVERLAAATEADDVRRILGLGD
jgi:ascorbate PTS system EIIA or EIIAB component